MKKETIRFKVFSLRNIENPFTRKGFRSYECVVDVKHLPDLENWREINVRDPKLTGSVPKKIKESFHTNLELFFFMNRGVLLSVDKVHFDQEKQEVEISLTDRMIHGIGDGGHTYTIIKEEALKLKEDQTQYIKLELITGFQLDDMALVVEGRNTSNQVKDQSLMELKNQFDKLKENLPTTLVDKISFSEYDTDENGNLKPIDIRDLIAILTLFNKDLCGDSNHPIMAYNSKKACLDRFRKDIDEKATGLKTYEKIYPLVKDILVLHDLIYSKFSELYNASQKKEGKVGGRFGNLTGVIKYKDKEGKDREEELNYSNLKSSYLVPSGFIYPLLNAFRAFIEEEKGVYVWGKGIDPINMLESDLAVRLAGIIGEEALKNGNPNKTGKSSLLWQSCYQAAELYYLKLNR